MMNQVSFSVEKHTTIVSLALYQVLHSRGKRLTTFLCILGAMGIMCRSGSFKKNVQLKRSRHDLRFQMEAQELQGSQCGIHRTKIVKALHGHAVLHSPQ